MNRSHASRRMFCMSLAAALLATPTVFAGEFYRHAFERRQLSDVYYSEGANAGDLNRDGKPDVVCGPLWFEGPDFQHSHELYPPKPQPLDFYADNFFSWVHDVNGDGWNDVFVVGFPGTPAHVYENPGDKPGHWPKHAVFDQVSNESPHFVDIVGDDAPELVCTRDGLYGFATIPAERPLEAWVFHAISDKSAPERFGHGLGVGDLNGDGLADVLTAGGWYEQPAENAEHSRWKFHEAAFTNAYGGAEMHAYDVDGDGDNDVITSLAAHEYGLAWYEQDRSGSNVVFRQHLIMGQKPEQSPYGLVFTELHSVALVDMNGDGLKDIVTGKTYWSHHRQSPMWDAGAVVYWFELARTPDGVDWIPRQADADSGIGRQVSVHDLNGDSLPDIVVGGMKGMNVLLHQRSEVSEADWAAAQPKKSADWRRPLKRGQAALKRADQASVKGAIEAESIKGIKVSGGQAGVQNMEGFLNDRWSNGQQVFWNGGKADDRLELEFELSAAGEYDVEAAFTMARDYAVVQPSLDGEVLGDPLDLFNFPDVLSTGVLTLGRRNLAAGKHRLELKIVGANPAAEGFGVGVDFLKCVAAEAAAE